MIEIWIEVLKEKSKFYVIQYEFLLVGARLEDFNSMIKRTGFFVIKNMNFFLWQDWTVNDFPLSTLRSTVFKPKLTVNFLLFSSVKKTNKTKIRRVILANPMFVCQVEEWYSRIIQNPFSFQCKCCFTLPQWEFGWLQINLLNIEDRSEVSV